MKASKPHHTYENLAKVIGYYGVEENELKRQKPDIIDKMLEAAHKDDLDSLHNLGYYLFSPSYEPSEYIAKFD